MRFGLTTHNGIVQWCVCLLATLQPIFNVRAFQNVFGIHTWLKNVPVSVAYKPVYIGFCDAELTGWRGLLDKVV